MAAPRTTRIRGSNRRLPAAVALGAALATLTACGARSDLAAEAGEVPVGPQGMTTGCPRPPSAPFTHRYGDADWQVAGAVAVDHHGYPVIAGTMGSTLDLDGTVLQAPLITPPPETAPFLPTAPTTLAGNFFVARLAPPGCTPFARMFSPPSQAHLTQAVHVALTDDDAVLLSFTFFGWVDLGGDPLGDPSSSSSGAFAALTPDGEHRFSLDVLANRVSLARAAHDAAGNIYLAGTFDGPLSIGGTAIGKSDGDPSTGATTDAFVAKLDPVGVVQWSRILRLGSMPDTFAGVQVAAWPDGGVAVSGRYAKPDDGIIDIGAGPITAPHQNGFVTAFTAAGDHRWSYLPSEIFLPADVRVAPSGAVVVAGGWDGFGYPLRRFDADLGWLGGSASILGPAGFPSLAVGPDDAAVIAASLQTPVAGDSGLLAFAVAPSGAALWMRSFIGFDANQLYRVAVDVGPSGTPILAGGFTGTMDLETGALSSIEGGSDVFVAGIQP